MQREKSDKNRIAHRSFFHPVWNDRLLCGSLLSALGDIGNIMNLLQYLLPALTLLSITASIGLRRKLYAKSALIVQFTSPAIFVVILIISSCLGLM